MKKHARMTRRSFLAKTATAAALAAGGPLVIAAGKELKMKPRPDLRDAESPKGLEVFQLTTEPDLSGAHLYMEAQIFTTDSKRFILHRSATAHGGSKHDPKHRYCVCDLENGGALTPIIEELACVAPSVSPDGTFVYYFVDETSTGGGRLTLKRVNLDGTDRRTVLVVDAPLPGTAFRPSALYPLSTISSDGKRFAISGFLGDGQTENSPFGLMVFDLEKATVNLIIHGRDLVQHALAVLPLHRPPGFTRHSYSRKPRQCV